MAPVAPAQHDGSLPDYAGAVPAPQAHAPNYAPLEENREEGEKPLPSISVQAFCDRQETAHCINETTRDWRMRRAECAAMSYLINSNSSQAFVMQVPKLS